MTVTYGYDDRGNTKSARGTGNSGSVERGWTDTSVPLDGTKDTFGVTGRQSGEVTQEYSIVNNRACLIYSKTVSTTLDPDTSALLRDGDDLFRKTTSEVRYIMDSVGRTIAASGVTETDGTTQNATKLPNALTGSAPVKTAATTLSSMKEGGPRPEMNPQQLLANGDMGAALLQTAGVSSPKATQLGRMAVINAALPDAINPALASNGKTITRTHSTTIQTFVMIGGAARGLESKTVATQTSGASQTQTLSSTRNTYDEKGRQTGAEGVSDSVAVNLMANDADRDGQTDSVSRQAVFSKATQTFRMINGQLVVVHTDTVSDSFTGVQGNDVSGASNVSRTVGQVATQYNDKAQVIGATGGAITRSANTVLTDGHPHLVVSLAATTNRYTVVMGQTMVLESKTATDSYTGYTKTNGEGIPLDAVNVTHSDNAVQNQYDQRAHLTGATGGSVGETRGTVATDDNQDGTVDRYVEQRTTFQTTNTYGVVAGSAQILQSVTDTRNALGATVTNSKSETRSSFNADGLLVGASGESGSITETQVLTEKKDSAGKTTGTISTPSVTTSSTQNHYVIVQGQSVVAQAQTTSVSHVGATTNVSSNTTDFVFDDKARLVSATGKSNGETTVRNIDGTVTRTPVSGENTFRVVLGASAVVRSVSTSTTYAGPSVTTTVSTMDYDVDTRTGATVGGRGRSTSETVTKNVDRAADGKVLGQSTTTTSSTSDTENVVVLGQLVAKKVVSGSTTTNGNSVTTSESTQLNDYNAIGQLTGGTGINSSTTKTRVWNDINGDKSWQEPGETEEQVTTTTGQNFYIPVLGQAGIWESESDSSSSSANTASATHGQTFYEWNDQGQMAAGSGTTTGSTTTENSDGTQETSTFKTQNQFAIVWGQAVLARSETDALESNVAGTSATRTNTVTIYRFENGELAGARAETHSTRETEVLHNGSGAVSTRYEVTVSEGITLFEIRQGQALAASVTMTSKTYADMQGRDVNTAKKVDTNTTVTQNQYNANGQLINALSNFTRSSQAEANGAFSHSDSSGVTLNIIKHGQSHSVRAEQTTTSYSQETGNNKGSAKVISSSRGVTTFDYNAKDQATGTRTVSSEVQNTKNNDGTWSQSYSRSTSDAQMALGEMRALPSETVSFTPERGGGAIEYIGSGLPPTVEDVLNTAQGFFADARALGAQAQGVLPSALRGRLEAVSGSLSWSRLTTNYNSRGQVTGGSSAGLNASHLKVYSDKDQNGSLESMVSLLSFSSNNNVFGVQHGSLSVSSVSNLSHNINPSEISFGVNNSHYNYDADGHLTGGSGSSNNRTETSVYNSESGSINSKTIYSNSTQTFGAYAGQPVLLGQTTTTRENNPFDTENFSVSNMSFVIGADGRTVSASGTNTTHTLVAHDPGGTGNVSYSAKIIEGTLSQTYVTYGGQSVVGRQTNGSNNTNPDGSSDNQSVSLSYTYDSMGRLVAASGAGTTSGNDGLGQTSTGTLSQRFVIMNGAAMLQSSRSISDSSGKGTSHSDITTTSGYDSEGRLTSMYGSGSVSGTSVAESGKISSYSGSVEQFYVIRMGAALLAKAINTNVSSATEDGISRTSTSVITTTYSYDRLNRLVAANASGTISIISVNSLVTPRTLTSTTHYDDWGGAQGQYQYGPWVGLVYDNGGPDLVGPPADTSSDSGEFVAGSYVVGSGTISQKLGVFYGQAKVLESTTKTTTTTYLSVRRITSSTKYNLSFVKVAPPQYWWVGAYTGSEDSSEALEQRHEEAVKSRDVTTTDSIYTTSKTTYMESTETFGYYDSGKQYGTLKTVQNGWIQKGGGAQVHFSMTRTNHSWDSEGRATSYTEDRWTEGSGSSHAVRWNIAYNSLGQVYSYAESYSKNGGDPATIYVNWIAYDSEGREYQKNQTVYWSYSTYGNVPGLQDGFEGWQNGCANVTITTSYDSSDRVTATSASGTVYSAWNSELASKRNYFSAFNFSSSTYNIVYDAYGRQLSYSYVNYMPGVEQKKKKQYAVMVVTSGTSAVLGFDDFDRATSTYSTYQKSANRASGWSLTTDIKYNDAGNVASQTERYYSSSKNGKATSKTNGLKTVTYSYDSKNQIVTRNENKIWEKTKSNGGGSSAKAILAAVITIVIVWFSGVYIPFGGESTLGAVAATGTSMEAALGMAAVSFAASFTVTLAMGGDIKTALISGLFAAVASFVGSGGLSQLTGGGGGFGDLIKGLDGALKTITDSLKSLTGFAEDFVTKIGEAIHELLPGNLGAGNLSQVTKDFSLAFTKSMVSKAVQDVVGIIVSDVMKEKTGSNLGFLTGLVSSLALGVLGFKGAEFFTGRGFMATLARVGSGFAIEKVLGPKNAWLSSLFLAMFTFNALEVKADTNGNKITLSFFEITEKNWAGGTAGGWGQST
ncbi:MAG: hypothetical protein IPP35_00625 [Elusimicrobia bacterium]|nr:hypothetical protein [Elusimicrobiota bacterium]